MLDDALSNPTVYLNPDTDTPLAQGLYHAAKVAYLIANNRCVELALKGLTWQEMADLAGAVVVVNESPS